MTKPDDGPLSPAESWELIEGGRRAAARSLRPDPLGLYLPWGLAYLLAFGAVWLTIGPDAVLAPGVTAAICVLSAVVAVATVLTTLRRSHRGVDGPTRQVSARYGWTWLLGFAALAVINGRLAGLGVPDAVVSLMWSGTALTVVGLLMLAGGVLWPGSGQYPLGGWILVSGVVSVLVGYPANFLVLALAGGGGLIVMAVVGRARAARA